MSWPHPSKHLNRRSGLSLAEIAIVLGVIGTLVGIIFEVASAVSYKSKLNRAGEDLGQIAINMRSMYTGRQTSFAALSPPATPNFTTYSQQYLQQGIFPSDMVTDPSAACANTTVNTPWNKDVGICTGTAQISLVGSSGNPVQFIVRYSNVPSDACVDLLTHNSLPGPTTGLKRIDINGNPVGLDGNLAMPLPMSVVAINAACLAGSISTLDWYYNLGSSM